MKNYLYIGMYLVAIVLANLLVSWLGPKAVIPVGFVLIGLNLTARDGLHEAWHNRGLVWKMGLLIGIGSLVTWLLNRGAGQVALASFLAFVGSAIVDTIVYEILHDKVKLIKINGSNIGGAFADSLLFPTLAFGAFMPLIILGQFTAKAIGGFFWSLVIK